MPQLDLLTIVIQVALIKFLFWGVYNLLNELIMPQYLRFLLIKEISWVNVNILSILIKYALHYFYLHLLIHFSKEFKLFSNLLKSLKEISFSIKFNFLKFIFNSRRLVFLKILNFSNNLNSIYAQNYRLNFFLKKNLTYSFVSKYYLNEFSGLKLSLKKKYSRIIVKYTRKYRLLEDETRINNLINGALKIWLNLKDLIHKSFFTLI